MERKDILVGVAFEVYVPRRGREKERISEDTVEHTAHGVLRAVTSLGYQAMLLPLRMDVSAFLKQIEDSKVNVVVNLCEGFRSTPQYESHIAAMFDLLDIPFTGNDAKALALAQDKIVCKAVLKAAGLPTPKSRIASSPDSPVNLNFPIIVKPSREDASIGIYPDSVVLEKERLPEQIGKIISTYEQPALVEEFIDGREFNVAVLDTGEPRALPVSEIDFSGMPDNLPRIVSYQAKWYESHLLFRRTPPVCPASIDESLSQKLQQVAVQAFRLMSCRDYARVDLRLANGGKMFILEVNPNPDVSLDAGYPRALAAAGISYEQFWDMMIQNALRRKGKA